MSYQFPGLASENISRDDMKNNNSVVLFQPRTGLYDLVVRNIPVGLLALARELSGKYDLMIIDQRLKGWKEKLDHALHNNPICVGITCQTGDQIRYALDVSRYIKQISNTPVIWGGIHPTLMPEQTVRNEYIDMVVAGEGEITIRETVDALREGRNLSNIPGLFYKESGVVCSNAPRLGNYDLNAAPPIPYECIDFRNYAGYAVQNFGKNTYYVETGRGCPYKCDYCYNSGMVNKLRRSLNAEKILDTIIHLRRFSPLEGVTFIDDSFLFERERVFTFTRLLRENKISLSWNCEANIRDINLMNNDELAELETSGLTWLALGVESGSQKILKESGKNLKIDDIREAAEKLSKYNFLTRYNFMSGYIGETESDLKDTTSLIRYLLRNNPRASIRGFTTVVPYPKTTFYSTATKHGLNEPERLEGWESFSPAVWGELIPWMNKREKRLRRLLYVASFFIDKKARINASTNMTGVIMRILSFIYRPIAFFRFARHSLFMPFELWGFFLFKKWVNRKSKI